jgi:hypothetical protein
LNNFSRKKIGENSSRIETRQMLSSTSSLETERHLLPLLKRRQDIFIVLDLFTERKAKRKNRWCGGPDSR